MKCTSCGENLTASEKYCPNCGKPAPKKNPSIVYCPACGSETERTAIFCGSCGQNLEEPQAGYKKQAQSKHAFSSSIKQSSGKRQLRNLVFAGLALLVIGIIALFIWVKNDPSAIDKLIDTTFPALFILGFILYIRRQSRKGKIKSGSGSNWDSQDDYDNDYDSDNEDDD